MVLAPVPKLALVTPEKLNLVIDRGILVTDDAATLGPSI